MSNLRAQSRAVVIAALFCAGLTAVSSCARNPAGPGGSPARWSPALVSAPFAGARSAFPASSGLSYVSMAPGAIPGGTTVTVSNRRNSASAVKTMTDGGLDPMTIAAQPGDMLKITVARGRGDTLGYGSVPPTSAPLIVRVSPANQKTNVALNDVIVVVFNEPMDEATLLSAVRLSTGGVAVAGTVTVTGADSLTAVFTPAALLSPAATYQVDVTTAAESQNDIALAAPLRTTFRTTDNADSPCEHDCWTSHASVPDVSWGAALVNGVIYDVRGLVSEFGSTMDAYNPSTETWTAVASVPTARYAPGVAALNGLVYVIGGDVRTVEAYDPQTNTWTTKDSLLEPLQYASPAVVNGTLYVFGQHGQVEAYDPAANRWTARTTNPQTDFTFGVGVIHGVVYVVGAANWCCVHTLATLDVYDPVTDSWASTYSGAPNSGMRNILMTWGVGVVNDQLYVLGGQPYDELDAMEVYHPVTNSWTAKRAPQPLGENWVIGMVTLNGQLYAIANATQSYLP